MAVTGEPLKLSMRNFVKYLITVLIYKRITARIREFFLLHSVQANTGAHPASFSYGYRWLVLG
jgi:hypothetical protein